MNIIILYKTYIFILTFAQARVLSPVFKIHNGAWGAVYKLCKIFLRPTFRLSFALDLPA